MIPVCRDEILACPAGTSSWHSAITWWNQIHVISTLKKLKGYKIHQTKNSINVVNVYSIISWLLKSSWYNLNNLSLFITRNLTLPNQSDDKIKGKTYPNRNFWYYYLTIFKLNNCVYICMFVYVLYLLLLKKYLAYIWIIHS